MKETNRPAKSKPRRKAMTVEGREDQLIAAAMDLAEEQILNGTASSQIITHFLKLGSTKERLEKEILAEQKKLVIAKTDALESSKHMEEMYAEAIEAMKSYRYVGSDGDEDE